MASQVNTSPRKIHPVIAYFQNFKILRDNPREFWVIQSCNFLDATGYFSLVAISTVFLSDNIGWSDIHAGYIVTAFSLVASFLLPIAGLFVDGLGIKKSLIAALSVQAVSRLSILACGLMTNLPGREWLVIVSFLLAAVGMSLSLPMYQAANRRFSTARSRGASFSVWYLVMNLGGIGGGLLVDFVRLKLGIDNSYIFAFGAAAYVLAAVVTVLFVSRIRQVEEDESDANDLERPNQQNSWDRLLAMVRGSVFWRLVTLMVVLLGVRSVFAYTYLLFPKYWIRVIGDKAEIGLLQAINPAVIVLGLILIIPISNRFNVFKMLIFGGIVSSSSLLILTLPHELFGNDVNQAYFRMAVLMLIIFSIGEVIWSPKLNEYIAAIAPKGQEGSYLGMSMVPWFFAKLVVGAMSGHLLSTWVPEGVGEQIKSGNLDFWDSPEAMFLILFAWAISGPLIALVFSRWFTKKADLGAHPEKSRFLAED